MQDRIRKIGKPVFPKNIMLKQHPEARVAVRTHIIALWRAVPEPAVRLRFIPSVEPLSPRQRLNDRRGGLEVRFSTEAEMTDWRDSMVDRPETDSAAYAAGWTVSGLAVLGTIVAVWLLGF